MEASNRPLRPLYRALASKLDAMSRCRKTNNIEWEEMHNNRLLEMVRNYMPSGSGWDQGTTMDLDMSRPDRLVFYGSFHHMDENGYYDGWTPHLIIVTPSLVFGFTVRVTGRNLDNIKDYLHDLFDHALRHEVED